MDLTGFWKDRTHWYVSCSIPRTHQLPQLTNTHGSVLASASTHPSNALGTPRGSQTSTTNSQLPRTIFTPFRIGIGTTYVIFPSMTRPHGLLIAAAINTPLLIIATILKPHVIRISYVVVRSGRSLAPRIDKLWVGVSLQSPSRLNRSTSGCFRTQQPSSSPSMVKWSLVKT
jgi:hypothetical protein